MDHHCNWLVNCIGFYNYKYFLVGLIYAVLLTIFATVTYCECFVDVVSHREKSLGDVVLFNEMNIGCSFYIIDLKYIFYLINFQIFSYNFCIALNK